MQFAYDSSNQVSVLFGGFFNDTEGHLYNDTWLWNGSAWTEVSPANQPSTRLHQCGAYDSIRNQMVVFGGFNDSWERMNDVWIWNGLNWTQNAGDSAIPKVDGEMAFDSNRGVCVLYTGGSGATDNISETWEFDSANWVKKNTPTTPPSRLDFNLVYDSANQCCVAFGGYVIDATGNWVGK